MGFSFLIYVELIWAVIKKLKVKNEESDVGNHHGDGYSAYIGYIMG